KTFQNEQFEIWQSDNGGEFRNYKFKDLIEKEWNSVQVHGAPHHPQSQGNIERTNQTVKLKLRSKLQGSKYWTSLVDQVVLEYNTCYHSSIQMTPFYAENGYQYMKPNITEREKKMSLLLGEELENHLGKKPSLEEIH